ncbi:MAG: efflux transporter outer membrane subunit [Cyanobacteria bacterium SIG26]|nr:efflux transporter outer membrane subunit [Cyanobacteria bacterium SIG26]
MLCYHTVIQKASVFLRGNKTLKKGIITVLLASFVLTNITPVASFALGDKNDQPKKVSITKSYKQRAKSDNFKYEYINYAWWDNFNDPILTGYIDRAIKNNFDLKMATNAVDEYYQAVKIQFANQLPMASVGVSTAYTKMPNTTSSDFQFVTPAFANYELDLFLKNKNKTDMSKKNYEASLQDERAAYIGIASAVGTTYLNIVKLDKMIELQEQIVQDRKVIYDLMLARNKEGLTSTADTVKANKAYIAGNTNLIDYKKNRTMLLNQLAVLLGENPNNSEQLTRISYDNLNFSGNIPTEISSDVISTRPDYIKAEKMVERAGIDVKVAKKEFLPTINLTGVALFLAGDIGSLWTTKNALAALAGGLNLPLFTGGRRIANLKLKKSTYERILNNYYKTNLTAIQEVNDALVTIKLDEEKYQDTKKQSELEREDFGYSTNRYEEGIISKLDLTQVKENVLYTDKAVVNDKVNCLINYIGLYKATGSQL